jgi:hypothetical protein
LLRSTRFPGKFAGIDSIARHIVAALPTDAPAPNKNAASSR